MNEILEIILGSAEGAFLEVGSFVGAVLLFFGSSKSRSRKTMILRDEILKN